MSLVLGRWGAFYAFLAHLFISEVARKWGLTGSKNYPDPGTRPRDIESKHTFEPSTSEFGSQARRSNFRRCFLSRIDQTAAGDIESMKSRGSVSPGQVLDLLPLLSPGGLYGRVCWHNGPPFVMLY